MPSKPRSFISISTKRRINKIIHTQVPFMRMRKKALSALIEKRNSNTHGSWIHTFRDLNKIENEKINSKRIVIPVALS